MQIPTQINLSNLIAAQSGAKAQKQPAPAPTFAAEAASASAEKPAFEPLTLRKAEPAAKPAGPSPFQDQSSARLGGQIDIKI